MGRGKHCTKEKRELIKKLISDGKTYKFVQSVVGCSAKMISNAIKWSPKPETRGRNKKICQFDVKRILRTVRDEPKTSATELKQRFNLDVHPCTVRRVLLDNNLHARSPRKVPLLKKTHITKRLKFAKQHRDWPLSKWRNILWSDGTKVVLFGSKGRRQYVRRKPNTEYDPRNVLTTVKHGGAKINVWGCFSYYGTGPLFWIKGNMDAQMYVDILENVMKPYAEWNMPLKWVFQNDNDPKHTSRAAKSWFLNNDIEVMDWPAQSPDLNPIENLWTDVKEAVYNARPKN